jgi:hypothetical protein
LPRDLFIFSLLKLVIEWYAGVAWVYIAERSVYTKVRLSHGNNFFPYI